MPEISYEIRRISTRDDLAGIAASIVGTQWGKDNELSDYRADALKEIVENPNNIQLIAYADNRPVGLALAMKIPSPDGDHWLYVDQLDTHPDYRRQGIGRKLLQELFRYAREWGLGEVWLATETNNAAANALYTSLGPSKSETLVDYTYTIK